jgi:peptidoglycan/LPS O-acetylase OafA/YrhL
MRFVALDSWRGICALLVAIFHFEGYWHLYEFPLVRHAWLFVDFFFVLSGFVITHAYMDKLGTRNDVGIFFLRRFGRLWPLHAAVLGALVGIELSKLALNTLFHVPLENNPFQDNTAYSVEAIPTNLLLIQGLGIHRSFTWNTPSWSISVEFWTYLAFAGVCYFSSTRRLEIAFATGICFFSVGIVFLFSHNFMATGYDYGLFRCLYGFFVGFLTYRIWEVTSPKFAVNGLFEIASLVLVIAFVSMVDQNIWSLAAPLVFAVVVWIFAHENGPISTALIRRPFTYLGAWSYSIYMTHWLVLIVMYRTNTVIAKLAKNDVMSSFIDVTFPGDGKPVKLLYIVNMWTMDLMLAGYLLVVIALSATAYTLIEQPSRKFFNRIGYRLSSRGTDTGGHPVTQPVQPGTLPSSPSPAL